MCPRAYIGCAPGEREYKEEEEERERERADIGFAFRFPASYRTALYPLSSLSLSLSLPPSLLLSLSP
jgi:hypothetical protein